MNFPGVGLSGRVGVRPAIAGLSSHSGDFIANFMTTESSDSQQPKSTPPPWWSNNPPTREELDEDARESLSHALEKND